MENEKRPWSLKGWIIAIAIVSILVIIGYAINLDYKRKARTAEVPGLLKEITKTQVVFREDPMSGNGRYASTIGTIGWVTGVYTYGDIPEDCSTHKKSLNEIVKSEKGFGPNSGHYLWACSKYFAYGASNKNNCSNETVGIFGKDQALGYAVPTWNIDGYPSDWQTGACTRLKDEDAVMKSFATGNLEYMREGFDKNFVLYHK